MAATWLLMRRLRELLRLRYEAGLSHRAIAQACAVGLGTVSAYLARALAAGVVWPLGVGFALVVALVMAQIEMKMISSSWWIRPCSRRGSANSVK